MQATGPLKSSIRNEKSLSWMSDSIRSRELTLMHQWCCYTHECTSPQWHRVLKEWVGREMIHCDYLMAAVYAFSSFHLAADALQDPAEFSSVREHVSVGLEYQSKALVGLQDALKTITTANASSILFTSILVAGCAIISSILSTGPQDQDRSAALALLPLVDHLRSIEFIKTQTIPFLQGSAIGKYIDRDYTSVPTDRETFIDELRALNASTSPSEHRAGYEKAICELEKVARIDDEIAHWIEDVGAEYLGGLRRGDNIALAIYMHWGVLLDKVERNWWAKFVGSRLVDELSEILANQGSEWVNIVKRCRKEVGLSDP